VNVIIYPTISATSAFLTRLVLLAMLCCVVLPPPPPRQPRAVQGAASRLPDQQLHVHRGPTGDTLDLLLVAVVVVLDYSLHLFDVLLFALAAGSRYGCSICRAAACAC
jgi:hypothetical protein